MKQVKREIKKGMLVKGKKAATKSGMKHNVKVMEKAILGIHDIHE